MTKIGERFNPHRLFEGSFIPEGISRYKGLSPGAKLVWGRFYRYGGSRGAIFPSIDSLGDEIGLGKTQTRQYVHELIEKRFVEFEQPDGAVRTYYFLWHDALEGQDGDLRMGGFQLDDTEPLRDAGVVVEPETPPGCRTGGLRDAGGEPLRDAGPKFLSVESCHLQGSVPPIIPQDETYEDETPQDRKRRDEAILKLSQSIWRRVSGDRKFNIHTRDNELLAERTGALSRKCGEDPFTANMETYLKEASKPTYKNFLDSFGQYRKEYPQGEAITDRQAIAEPAAVAVDPPIQPASSNAQKQGSGLPELVVAWNERMKNAPKVEIWVRSGRTHEDLLRNLANPDFVANREALFERCDTLAVFSKTHKFGMVFDFAFCMKNWAGILNGQYNYLTSGETAKKKLAVDSVLAKLHKDIAARKAAEQKHAS